MRRYPEGDHWGAQQTIAQVGDRIVSELHQEQLRRHRPPDTIVLHGRARHLYRRRHERTD